MGDTAVVFRRIGGRVVPIKVSKKDKNYKEAISSYAKSQGALLGGLGLNLASTPVLKKGVGLMNESASEAKQAKTFAGEAMHAYRNNPHTGSRAMTVYKGNGKSYASGSSMGRAGREHAFKARGAFNSSIHKFGRAKKLIGTSLGMSLVGLGLYGYSIKKALDVKKSVNKAKSLGKAKNFNRFTGSHT